MADEIWQRVVEPTQAASALFDTFPYLTRLYTTISPADMNKDPVFSFNAQLPTVSNIHNATMNVSCDVFSGAENSAELVTEQGWRMSFPKGRYGAPGVDSSRLPAALRIEILREEGPPLVVADNSWHRPRPLRSCAAGPPAASLRQRLGVRHPGAPPSGLRPAPG